MAYRKRTDVKRQTIITESRQSHAEMRVAVHENIAADKDSVSTNRQRLTTEKGPWLASNSITFPVVLSS